MCIFVLFLSFNSKEIMKKIYLTLFFSLFCLIQWANAQTNTPKSEDMMPQFQWTSLTHDFGTIEHNKPVTAEFEFVNSGKKPLIIQSARGSCGCTGVKYPVEPIAPGEKGKIAATFNAAAVGTFHKSVTVNANTSDGSVMLFIKGEVKPAK
jgi:hypothetical protein